jgi:hypothetical protein
MKRTAYLDMGEVSPNTKRKFYEIMYSLNK